MRGFAAVSVLLYHVLALNWSTLQNGVYLKPASNPWANVLIFSPLHIAWLGIEAVWFFFVLSGFVLTKMAARPGFSWQSYYPSRIVRLYGPVVAAVVVVWLGYHAISYLTGPAGPGVSADALSYPPANVLNDLTLVGGTSTSIGVLWSLQWEVVFSLALPLYIFLVRKHPWSATVVAVIGSLVGWLYANQVLMYLPIFFFGALLAQYWDQVLRAFSFLGGRSWKTHLAGIALLLVALTAMTSFFVLGRPIEALGLPSRVVTLPIVLLGMLLAIVLSVSWRPLSAFLSWRGVVFLGTISFSLYLVHRPVMLGLGYVFGIGWAQALIEIVVALAVATGFYYALERPIHRLSRRVADRLREPVPRARTAESAQPVPDESRPR